MLDARVTGVSHRRLFSGGLQQLARGQRMIKVAAYSNIRTASAIVFEGEENCPRPR